MDDERRAIGGRIAIARRAAGLTQRELARRLGVTPRSIQNYESGAIVPYKHLRRIEVLAHKRIGWILAGDDGDDDMAQTLGRLENALDRHHALLQEHIETIRRQTELLRRQREAASRRRSGDRTER
jgi:transcriptional regulator with XRE-family HTH domain